jgi:hypothetical protein
MTERSSGRRHTRREDTREKQEEAINRNNRVDREEDNKE